MAPIVLCAWTERRNKNGTCAGLLRLLHPLDCLLYLSPQLDRLVLFVGRQFRYTQLSLTQSVGPKSLDETSRNFLDLVSPTRHLIISGRHI